MEKQEKVHKGFKFGKGGKIEKVGNAFVYTPNHYPGAIAIDAKPSKECNEYHKKHVIQINLPSQK